MVEENFKFKSSETRQNEGFGVEAHSILHVEENFKFKSSETHQNEGFLGKI